MVAEFVKTSSRATATVKARRWRRTANKNGAYAPFLALPGALKIALRSYLPAADLPQAGGVSAMISRQTASRRHCHRQQLSA